MQLRSNETYNIMCQHMVFDKRAVESVMPHNSYYFSLIRSPVKAFVSFFIFYNNDSRLVIVSYYCWYRIWVTSYSKCRNNWHDVIFRDFEWLRLNGYKKETFNCHEANCFTPCRMKQLSGHDISLDESINTFLNLKYREANQQEGSGNYLIANNLNSMSFDLGMSQGRLEQITWPHFIAEIGSYWIIDFVILYRSANSYELRKRNITFLFQYEGYHGWLYQELHNHAW